MMTIMVLAKYVIYKWMMNNRYRSYRFSEIKKFLLISLFSSKHENYEIKSDTKLSTCTSKTQIIDYL